MNTAVYFVKDKQVVGVGQGFVAWGLVNAVSILECMKKGFDSAQTHYKELKRERFSQCDLIWNEHMSKWFTTEEEFTSFDYAIVLDFKIPRDWFKEMQEKSLDAKVLTDRKDAGLLVKMPVEELQNLLVTH
jgi:hypothetical protein